ncbi:hypothetical protein [Brevibacillus borstelensis]|uniref:hypothetical protein n=1 Tax=Brevibacillus borstelensis TaxID=45462 RepID=UPI0030BA85CB
MKTEKNALGSVGHLLGATAVRPPWQKRNASKSSSSREPFKLAAKNVPLLPGSLGGCPKDPSLFFSVFISTAFWVIQAFLGRSME